MTPVAAAEQPDRDDARHARRQSRRQRAPQPDERPLGPDNVKEMLGYPIKYVLDTVVMDNRYGTPIPPLKCTTGGGGQATKCTKCFLMHY